MSEESPWLAARLAWNDRFSSLAAGSQNWRRAFFAAAFIAAVSASGNVIQATKAPHFTSWIVVADKSGDILSSGPAEHTDIVDDTLKRKALAGWVEAWRGVSSDATVQQKWVGETYAMLGGGTAAEKEMASYFTENQPYTRAATELVSVEVRSVLPTSDRTYRVQWGETTRTLVGERKEDSEWEASLTIAVSPPKKVAEARKNPLGIFVTDASWSRIYGVQAREGGRR